MKILILWSSLADYTVACFKKLTEYNNTVRMVYQPVNQNAPFKEFDFSLFESVECDEVSERLKLHVQCIEFKPDIVLMASWNFKHYMKIAKSCRENGSKVIAAFDNQWNNTLKQNIGRIISPFYLQPVIDNFLVPGDRQAQMAMRFGYNSPFYGFYCANSDNFKNITYNPNNRKFVFIGRLIEQKGIRNLILAYSKYRKEVENPWSLIVAGTGPLKHLFNDIEGVEFKSFVQPNELKNLFGEASCFILPSLHENWGLVIHEAALAGMPILCTSTSGASTWFLRDGLNGYLLDTNTNSILNSMLKMHRKSNEELVLMSQCSQSIGDLWTVDKWANVMNENFKSILAK